MSLELNSINTQIARIPDLIDRLQTQADTIRHHVRNASTLADRNQAATELARLKTETAVAYLALINIEQTIRQFQRDVPQISQQIRDVSRSLDRSEDILEQASCGKRALRVLNRAFLFGMTRLKRSFAVLAEIAHPHRQ